MKSDFNIDKNLNFRWAGVDSLLLLDLSPDIYVKADLEVLEAISPNDTAEDGDSVRRWLDQTSNKFFTENPTMAIQSTFRSSGISGQPSVDFSRANGDGLFWVSASNPTVAGVAGVANICRDITETYMAVIIDPVGLTVSPGFQHIIGCSINGSTAARFSISINGNNRFDLNTKRLDADANDVLSLTAAALVDKPTIVIGHINWTTGFKTLRAINDTTNQTATKTAAHGTGNTQDTASQMVSMGSVSSSAVPYDGDISEAFVKQNILSAAAETTLIDFWKDKYSI